VGPGYFAAGAAGAAAFLNFFRIIATVWLGRAPAFSQCSIRYTLSSMRSGFTVGS